MEQQFIELGHVLVAAVLGGIVGLERERQQKPAGFRTHMVISSACALLVILGKLVMIDFVNEHLFADDQLETDPIRIIQAIVIGVSFIGTGTILKQSGSDNILYLTTAATILLSASIGICVALEQYFLSVGVVVLVLLINSVVKKVDHKIQQMRKKE